MSNHLQVISVNSFRQLHRRRLTEKIFSINSLTLTSDEQSVDIFPLYAAISELMANFTHFYMWNEFSDVIDRNRHHQSIQ
jgi:hypothetical protein